MSGGWTAKERQWRIIAIKRRDGPVCWLCRTRFSKGDTLTIDHAIPKGRGGTNALSNLRLAHNTCNGRRGMIAETRPRAVRLRLQSIFTSAMSAGTAATPQSGAGLQPASATGKAGDAQ